MSQEKQLDEYPEKYQVIMSTPDGNMGSALVGANNREGCILGMHHEFPKATLTVHLVKS